ncbi:hypothetical protein Tco_0355239 [Tanacetum coccineum]
MGIVLPVSPVYLTGDHGLKKTPLRWHSMVESLVRPMMHLHQQPKLLVGKYPALLLGLSESLTGSPEVWKNGFKQLRETRLVVECHKQRMRKYYSMILTSKIIPYGIYSSSQDNLLFPSEMWEEEEDDELVFVPSHTSSLEPAVPSLLAEQGKDLRFRALKGKPIKKTESPKTDNAQLWLRTNGVTQNVQYNCLTPEKDPIVDASTTFVRPQPAIEWPPSKRPKYFECVTSQPASVPAATKLLRADIQILVVGVSSNLAGSATPMAVSAASQYCCGA